MPTPFHDPDALARLAAGHERLMQRLRAAMTDDMLEEIAAADYGTDYARHLAALKVIRAKGVPAGPMDWEPKEVLELFHWSEYGDNRTGQRPRTVSEFHLMRAFCCVALVTVTVDPAGHGCMLGGPNAIIAQLIDSLESLGSDWEQDGAAFLAWALQRVPGGEDETAFFVFGLILLLVRTKIANDETAATIALCDWLTALEEEVVQMWGHGIGTEPDVWLLRTTHFYTYFAKWRAIGRRLASGEGPVSDAALAARLADIGHRLSGEA